LQKYVDRKLVPGVVTIVARKGRVVAFDAIGYADVEKAVPMRTDSVFRIASMTKPIASVALMMLWEEGAFQLSDPVEKFLPEFHGQQVSTTSDASAATGTLVPVTKPATIRQLLTHTAGLANNYIGNREFYRQTMEIRPDDTLESLIKRLAALPLNYQPGEAWQYSAATDVVGRIVEVVSGIPFDRFLAERIFEPLEMTDTRFFLDDPLEGRFTAQYKPGKDDVIELDDPATLQSRWINGGNRKVFRGAGGLLSTAHDYIRFQQMMLNGGELDGVRLLAPSTVSLMLENHTGNLPLWIGGPGIGFGLGYGVVVDRGAAATPQSNGTAYWGGAYCTAFWIDRTQHVAAALMTQVRPYDHLDILRDFQNLVYQAIVD
jgi:CubicO group peptidase (beta-lactamase class C family)